MLWLMAVLVFAPFIHSTTDGPGLVYNAECSFSLPSLDSQSRVLRPLLTFPSSLLSMRASLCSSDTRTGSTPEPQKPLRTDTCFSEQSYKAFPIEPVQPPTVTLYTF